MIGLELMKAAEAVADLHQAGRVAEAFPTLRTALVESSDTFVGLVCESYRILAIRFPADEQSDFLFQCLDGVRPPADCYTAIVDALADLVDASAVTNLHLRYINAGGGSLEIYEALSAEFMSAGEVEIVAQISRVAIQNGVFDRLSNSAKFNFATKIMAEGNLLGAFEIYSTIYDDPYDREPAFLNIYTLAKKHQLPEAIRFIRALGNGQFEAYSPRRIEEAKEVDFDLAFHDRLEGEVVDALIKNGFCVIRDGCDPDVVASARRHIDGAAFNAFPAVFDQTLVDLVDRLFRFDAVQIVRDVLKYPASLDLQCCMVRRVSPVTPTTFTPFHQDVTAFFKAVVNIWTPLTPAGGEYPSIEFIRKRITRAEQTKIFDGEYNLVEIDEAVVLEKYGDALFELTTAKPGDCVMFLGSTIHRSSNLRNATQTRYNLEVRWA